MYLDHFGLSRFPFTIAPDPDFLFPSSGHQEALAHLQYALSGHGGLICLTGEVGTGKTTLCRVFLGTDAPDIKTAYIFNPQLSARELLQSLCDELGIGYSSEASQKSLYASLNEALLSGYASGQRVICVIDEAQSMPAPLLEQIRLLTNLETNREKLLTLILVGQPELRDILARHELRQLNQRITARYHLNHLNELETLAYLKHRLATAGCHHAVFDAPVANIIWNGSGGVPRLINSIADRALLGAYANGLPAVTPSIARQALQEVTGLTRQGRRSNASSGSKTPSSMSPVGLLGGAVIGGLLVAAGYLTWQKQDVLEQWLSPASALVGAGHGSNEENIGSVALANASSERGSPEAIEVEAINAEAADATGEGEALSVVTAPPGPEAVLAESLGLPGGNCDALREAGWHCSWVGWSRQQLVEAGMPVAVKGRRDGQWRAVQQPTHPALQGVQTRALIAWQPPTGYRRGVKPGQSGAVVGWVRQQLGMEWHGGWTVIGPQGATNARPDENLYDPLLANRVMQFQVQHGLDADQILGPQTLIFLQRYPEPAVQGES